jgi:transcriptional regulator
MSAPFDRWTDLDIRDLVAAYPLAWIVAGPVATPMPMLLDLDSAGRPVSLTGHLPRSGPLFQRLQADPRALFLFQGPQGYISPQWTGTRDWAPTWNFACARIEAEVAFDDGLTASALERVVAHMERGRPEPWTVAELGPRYARLAQAVVGFRAPIRSLSARFKLGQDERDGVLAHILHGLEDENLVAWMTRFNAGRI